MPNLEGLGLQNFRTFQKKENLEFSPITLITGSNNAGKSSVFKAIQFLVHNFKDGIISETLDFKAMHHELGSIERVLNREVMTDFKSSKKDKNIGMYFRLMGYHEENKVEYSSPPIFEEEEDLVFSFPLKFGGSREISANLEIRYELNQFIKENGTEENLVISHSIKSIGIVRGGEYLHWSNIVGYMENYDDSPHWEMETSIDLKKMIKLITETPFVNIEEGIEPNEKTKDYFTLNLYSRIEKYRGVFFDFVFPKSKKDGYENFIEKIIKGKSLFSDYSEITNKEEKLKLEAIQENVFSELLKGKNNNQGKILECFNHSFSSPINGMERGIVSAELKEDKGGVSDNVNDIFTSKMFDTTPNSKLFTSLLASIEKDFLDIVQNKINSLKKVYFLPTTRGRNREWFIDEQNSEDIQIVRDFSNIYLESHPQIENFVNFWIGKGEVDENGIKKLKGFKIGKELSVFRDETIGLTKVFLINFDGTKTPLVDLGYGVSQLLPIIMKIAVISHKHQRTYEYDFNHQEGHYERQTIYFTSSTLLIEEPEANLHPSLQSKMAELLIDAGSRFNIQFILETHSEYLIYKFQEYIGEKKVSKNDVKMYYFNHPNDVREGLKANYINQVEIGTDGSIDYDKYFGRGFFDEQTNLKLSLLNIQRNSFIEDYETIKEELINSSKELEKYDSKIEKLNEKLTTSTSGIDKLQKEINEITQEKEEKELEFQKLIIEQENKIDEYTTKIDYSKYLAEIKTIIDETKINNSKTLQYLSTGKFLLKNLDDSADFAPVIIQYGRAVEFEMIKWVNNFKNSISPTLIGGLCDTTNYTNTIRKVFADKGLALDASNSSYEVNTGNKIGLFNLRDYIQNNNKWVFGKLTQIFELIYYTSPAKNITYNYNSVPLVLAFSNYLKGTWTDYDTAEGLFNTCRYILDLRNCAGHTYSNSVCSSDIIDKSIAEGYVAKVEAFFKCL